MIGPREFEMVEVDGVRYVKGEEPKAVVKVAVEVAEPDVKEAPQPRNKAARAENK